MKQKRITAALLAAALCLGMATVPAAATTSASDAQAYLDILDRTNPNDSYLIDFDGDGRDELLTVRDSHYSLWGDYLEWDEFHYYSVYQGDRALVEDAVMEMAGGPDCSVETRDGKTYINSYNAAYIQWYKDYYTVLDGQWVQVVRLDSQGYEYADGTTTSSYLIDGQEVSREEFSRVVNSFDYQFSLMWDRPSWDVRDQLEAIAGGQNQGGGDMTPAEALAGIAYYGDRSACRMSADMAEAYAGALDTVLSGEPGYRWRAVLLDVSGDGLPILLVVAEDDYLDVEMMYHLPHFYEYRNGQAVERNFLAEVPDNWVDTYAVFDTPDGPLLGATFFGFNMVPEYAGGYYYQVSEGTLSLRHTITGYAGYGSVPYDEINWSVDGAGCEGAPGEALGLVYRTGILEPTSMAWISDCEFSSASTVSALLRSYAAGQDAYGRFPKVTEENDQYVQDVARAVADAVSGEIAGVYRLADGVYYVIVVVNGAEQGALVEGSRENGRLRWRVTRADPSPLEEDALERLASGMLAQSNLDLDYGRIGGFGTGQELLGYLQDRLDNVGGVAPNDAAKTELAAYIESAISSRCSQSLSGGDNRLTADANALRQLATRGRGMWSELGALLEQNGVALNKTVVIVIRVLWQDLDWSQPCQVTLTPAMAESLDGCTIQFLLADGQHYLQLSAERLRALTNQYGTLGVQLAKAGDHAYTVAFLDGQGAVVDQLSAPVTIGLPADSMTSTIMAAYSGGSDNWGGQYDPSAGILSFETPYSGQYEVLENDIQINDISGLPGESQTAIRFLVSKGFLSLENGSFDPSGSLTRYQFTQALVGMFFALDRELTTDFPDVPANSPYYAYVASAQARSIVNGFDNGTFSGERNISREQVFALAARTLMEQKGYTLPADSGDYLYSFTDGSAVSAWAADQVALSVREGIVDRGGELQPGGDISREQAAVTLYRLFQLLYEVSPVVLELPPVTAVEQPPVTEPEPEPEPSQGGGFPIVAVIIIAAVVVVAAAAAATVLVVKKKKKSAAVPAAVAVAPATTPAPVEQVPAAPAPEPQPVPPAVEPQPAPQPAPPVVKPQPVPQPAPPAAAPVPSFCPKCGTPLPPGGSFCPNCGHSVRSGS